MPDHILNVDDDVLKMLSYDVHAGALILKIGGKWASQYRVSPVEYLDHALKKPQHPSHIDALLDARNYIYKEHNVDLYLSE